LAFLAENKAKSCKILIITLVFVKNVNFFAENYRKSQKIVIITSTPDWANFRQIDHCFLLLMPSLPKLSCPIERTATRTDVAFYFMIGAEQWYKYQSRLLWHLFKIEHCLLWEVNWNWQKYRTFTLFHG
jgi:hypothetical protein